MKQETVYAPLTGSAVPMAQVPDPVFAENVIGQGVAILPTDPVAVAPVDGEITAVARTYHAFCIRTDQGLDLLIHLGIDTVNLGGKGFTCYVEKGQRVRRGDPVIRLDLKLCARKKLQVISPCIVVNGEEFPVCKPLLGPVKAGETPIMICAEGEEP